MLPSQSRFLWLGSLLTALVSAPLAAPAQTARATPLWQDVSESAVRAALPPQRAATAKREIVPEVYRTLQLDMPAMRTRLAAAPREFSAPIELSGLEISLPLPYGGFGRFLVQDSPIMEAKLAAKYPELKTYVAQGIDDPTATARLDVTPRGFRALVLSSRGQFYIDPYWADEDRTYIAYYKRNFKAADKTLSCGVMSKDFDPAALLNRAPAPRRPTGAQLRTYRLAVGATAEYTAAVSGTNPGTVAQGLAAMITTVNRVSAVYERDLAIRLQLVNNTDLLIFTDAATDGYTNASGGTLLGENQLKCDAVIGTANYDIGHVFSTGGGGIAGLGVVCLGGQKARGVTGLPNPTGDPYDIDFVAHEMGHQFGGNHPFNATSGNCAGGNREPSAAYEPGSGTSIMAYAGICSPQDLAPNSDDYFHAISYQEIDLYTTTVGGGNCAVSTPTGNSPPVIAALTNRVIPSQTPFALTAAATDANGDTLTYCWEQFDLGPAQDPTAAPRDNGSSPIFRSFDPTTNPTRTFPSLSYILNNANVPPPTLPSGFISGEFLPTTNRTMTFRVTVRDNRAGGGGSDYGSMTVQSVAAAGPFRLSSQNTAATFAAGDVIPVSWDVAGTTANGINCANVNIRLSTDGGVTFPTVLAANVPNSGTANVTIPNVAQSATTQGRLKVEAVGNVFFDINDANLTITSTNASPTIAIANGITITRGAASAVTQSVGTASDANGNALTVAVSDVPADTAVTASINAGTISLTAQANCSITTTNSSRTYPMTLTVTDSIGSTASATVNLIITPNPAPTVGAYTNGNAPRGSATNFTPASGPADANGNITATPLTLSPTTLPGGGTIALNQATGVVTVTPILASTLGVTNVRVQIQDSCGATTIRQFAVTVTSDTPTLSAGALGALAAESCTPANGAVDPGELVTVNLPVVNAGGSPTVNVVGTLQTSGGVTPVDGATQNYGVIGASATVSRPFTFLAAGACGGSITASLQLQDGAINYGTVTYTIQLGATQVVTSDVELFDGVTAPALPAGWVSQVVAGAMLNFRTVAATADTAPNSIFTNTVATASEVTLTSPAIAIPAVGVSQLRFAHRWNTEPGYDGGVLEISVNAGAFNDVIAAGGAFVSGAYTGAIDVTDSPLTGRNAWTGSNNAAYTTTLVTLPGATAGQSVRFRWRLASDTGVSPGSSVWRIDSIRLVGTTIACATCSSSPVFTSGLPASPLTVGTFYTHTFVASGSPAPTFSLRSGVLPPGLTLSASGVLSGTPTSAGNGQFADIIVRASNGVPPNVDQTFTLNVRTSATNYLAGFGLTGPNAAFTADPNFDGVTNLLAYGLGLNPNNANAALLPVAAIKNYAGVPYVYLTFNRSSVATDLTYNVQASADLQSWSTIATSSGGAPTTGAGFVAETGSAPTFQVEVRDTQPVDPVTGARRFLRLQVTSP